MPNVLHVFKIYYPEIFGGVQQSIYEIAEGTIEYGYKSTVFALSANARPEEFNVGRHKAITFNQQFYLASTGFSISVFKPFRKLVEKADIIHYHYPWPFMDLLHSVLKPKKPAIVTYHSDIVKQNGLLKFYQPLMRSFLLDMQRIVVTSPNYLQSSPILQQYAKKTKVIPLGISDHGCTSNPALVQKWRSKVGEGFFLFLGKLRYYKGLNVLIEAARQTGLPVVIAGTGDQEKYLKALAPKNVIFVGHYTDDDRSALLLLARGFVFPSNQRSEAFGISLLEAARASVPMICCEIGTGTTYVNIHGITGLVIQPNDPISLAAAMMRLNTERDMAVNLGRAARQRFEKFFTSRQMAAAYAEEYQTVLTSKT